MTHAPYLDEIEPTMDEIEDMEWDLENDEDEWDEGAAEVAHENVLDAGERMSLLYYEM